MLLVLAALVALPAAVWMVWTVAGEGSQAALLRGSQIAYALNLVVQFVAGIVVLVWADRIVTLFESDVTPPHVDITHSS